MTQVQESVPRSIESEVSVVGALLFDPRAIPEVRSLLDPADFYRAVHGKIYRAVCELWDRSVAVDVITVDAELGPDEAYVEFGGQEYLAELIDAVPTSANVAYHARVVRDKATRRRLIDAARKTIQDAHEADDAESAIARSVQRALGTSKPLAGSGYVSIGDSMMDAMDEIAEEANAQEGDVRAFGVQSGIPKLDRLTRGMRAGDLTVLAARPSMGKTALAVQVGIRAARQQRSVLVASLEMSRRQLVRRGIASYGRIDVLRAATSDDGRLAQAATAVSRLPIRIDDNPGETIHQLRAGIMRAAATEPPDLIIVDYLQLMESDGENRNQQISQVSRGLKRLARETDAHVIALSQLSRNVEHRTPPRPVLSDLRDSGAVEQDADVVLLLWRPEYYFDDKTPNEQRAKWQNKGELIIGKQRNGPTGSVKLYWDPPSMTFTELTEA